MTTFELAHRLLSEYEESGKYVNLSLNSHLTDNITREERAALTALLYGAVEKKMRYDYYISALSGRGIDKINPRVRNILRLGMCALADMDRIPDYAAVNECVKLTKNAGERSFVNAVLRRAAREKENLPLPDKSKNPQRFYSVYYSLPLATVKYLVRLLGEESAAELFKSTLERSRETSLTVNTLKISPSDFIKKLNSMGYQAEKSQISDISVKVCGSLNPRDISGFSEGEFFVQDEASALAAAVVGLRAGETVIDTCAAPGGKSFAMAILSEDKADVRSLELHESKLSLISDGAKRLGLSSVKAIGRDALLPDEALFGTVDRVLCDVPCSGLGVMGKKPDLRYKDIASLADLPALQLEILEKSAEYLRAGGVLVYSTCTLIREENEGVIERFISENPDFEFLDFNIGNIKSSGGVLTLYPHVHATDGFFIAKLRKKK